MTGKYILDTAFILGLLVQVTKLSDLIFLEKQKKKIQDKVEILTLTLEDVKPVRYFHYIFERKIIRLISIIVGLLPATYLIGTIIFYAYKSAVSDVGKEYTFKAGFMTGILLIVLLTYLGFQFYGMKIIRWMTKDIFINFFWKYLLIFFGFSFFIWAINILVSLITHSPNALANNMIFSIVLAVSGCLGVWYTVAFYGFLVILYRSIIFLFEIILKVCRSILWRITEYNKGAVAAITLIFTVILGVVNYFYNYH